MLQRREHGPSEYHATEEHRLTQIGTGREGRRPSIVFGRFASSCRLGCGVTVNQVSTSVSRHPLKHPEKVAPVAAAVSALATLVCCLPVGIAAAAATASLGAIVSGYRSWFLGASALLLVIGIVQVRAQRGCATRTGGSMAILAVSGTIVLLVALFPQVLAGLIADWLP